MSLVCEKCEEKQEPILKLESTKTCFISKCANFEDVTQHKGHRKLQFLFDSVKNEVTELSPDSALFEQQENTKEEDTMSNELKYLSSEKKGESEDQLEKIQIFEECELQDYRKYFRASDWVSLLFIIEKIRNKKANGVLLLWRFVNKFEGKRKLLKGKRIFKLLQYLNLENVIEMLIWEEEKDREIKKMKDNKNKDLVFNMVNRII